MRKVLRSKRRRNVGDFRTSRIAWYGWRLRVVSPEGARYSRRLDMLVAMICAGEAQATGQRVDLLSPVTSR